MIDKLIPWWPQIKLFVQLMLVCAVLGGAAMGGFVYERNAKDAEINDLKRQYAEAVTVATQAQLDQVAANDELKQKAETQHAKDQIAVNDLFASLGGLHVAIPVCPEYAGQANAPGSDTDVARWVFQQRIDDAVERAKQGIAELIQRADQLNIDAREANAAAELEP